jgi:hypothetical protein
VTLRRYALLAALALTGCAGSQRAGDAPQRGPDVIIPTVSEDKAKSADTGPPPPTGVRDPLPTGEPGSGDLEPESEMDPWGTYGATSSPRGGPDCDRAADCCQKLYRQMGDPSVQRVCASLRTAPASICANVLTSFQQAGSSLGISCN